MKKNLELFWIFFKIGLFTFGGGLAMIPIISNQVVEKKGWIDEKEMVDMIAISESTPGVIAINSATFVGYRVNGILGALFSTIAVIIPSLTIICIISVFLEQFLAIKVVYWAFLGIKAGVCVLIFNAALKLYKHVPKKIFYYALLVSVFILYLIIKGFSLNISSIYMLIISAIVSVIYNVIYAKYRKKEEVEE